MKNAFKVVLLILVLCFFWNCKTIKTNNLLNAEETWRKEELRFPLLFARSLPYKGEEHIRFAKGWGDTSSEEYFSYVFAWILEDNPNLDEDKIASDMTVYFSGLMKMGLITKFRFFKKLPLVQSSFIASNSTNKDFTGEIEVYDAFFKKEVITLHVKSSVSYCYGLKKHLVMFRLSPQQFENAVWNDLNAVEINAHCEESE